MDKVIDLAGRKFGHWVVLAIHPGRSRYRHDLWLCRCDCGTERVVRGDTLRRGKSTRCFECTQRPALRGTPRPRTRHGLSKTRAYRVWHNMLDRCYNENKSNFPYYGGRGIGAPDWVNFVPFFADVGDAPDGLTLNRPNNDADYGPCNWGWAPPSVQAANRRPPRPRPINVVSLRERLAFGGRIRPRERGFLLACIDACVPPHDAAGGFTLPPF